MKKYEEEAGYETSLWYPMNASDRMLAFNQTSKDPVLRKIFRDKRFRIAVSQAINREEISQILHFGMTEPQQAMPPKGTLLYEATKHVAKLYTEYDPAKANRLLDEMGLDKRSAEGWRLRPDGEELFLNFETYQKAWTPSLEMVVDHLRNVGLKASFKIIDLGLFNPRAGDNEMDCYWTAGHSVPVYPDHFVFFPKEDRTPYAPAYGLWYASDGEKGEEPTGEFMENIKRYEQMMIEPDAEKRFELQVQIVTTAVEEL
ncbi:unnamed protein product, partial [marine sediment metagenome]